MNGGESTESRKSFRPSAGSKLPALPKVAGQAEETSMSPKNAKMLGYSGIGGESAQYLPGEDRLEENKFHGRKKSEATALLSQRPRFGHLLDHGKKSSARFPSSASPRKDTSATGQ
jgi:hypothetical protein